mgnify:CR=1 FL=1
MARAVVMFSAKSLRRVCRVLLMKNTFSGKKKQIIKAPSFLKLHDHVLNAFGVMIFEIVDEHKEHIYYV